MIRLFLFDDQFLHKRYTNKAFGQNWTNINKYKVQIYFELTLFTYHLLTIFSDQTEHQEWKYYTTYGKHV